MKVQLPPKSFLSKNLAVQSAKVAGDLTKSQICDCIEILSGVSLSPAEKRQSKIALIQMLQASLPNPRNAGRKPIGDSPRVQTLITLCE